VRGALGRGGRLQQRAVVREEHGAAMAGVLLGEPEGVLGLPNRCRGPRCRPRGSRAAEGG